MIDSSFEFKDPVCGMTVTEGTAVSIVEWGGVKYGFCAEYCHDLFMKHPEKFVETKTEEIDEKSSCCSERDETKQEKDPVCGMNVDPKNAVAKSEYNGKKYYFCCTHCKTKFDADPESYLGGNKPRKKAVSEGANVKYTCPMHPEVISDKLDSFKKSFSNATATLSMV